MWLCVAQYAGTELRWPGAKLKMIRPEGSILSTSCLSDLRAEGMLPERCLVAAVKSQWMPWEIVDAAMGKRGLVDEDVLAKWREYGGDVDAPVYGYNMTMLSIAVSNVKYQVTRALLEHGANPNHRGKHGMTSLGAACQMGNLRLVKLLLLWQGDPNQRDDEGFTILHNEVGQVNDDGVHEPDRPVSAWLRTFLTVAKLDEIAPDGDTALFKAIATGRRNYVRALLDNGARVDLVAGLNTDGSKTALLVAAQKGDDIVTSQLIEHGANVDYRNEGGRAALHLAAQMGHAKVLDVLISSGATVDLQCDRGMTALSSAASFGQIDAARLLISKGANVSHRDPRNMTLVDYAQHNGHHRMMRLLSEMGANRVYGDWTPMTRQGMLLIAFLMSFWVELLVIITSCMAVAWCRRSGAARRSLERATQPKKAKPRRRKAAGAPTDEPEWWLELSPLHDALDDAAKVERPDFICSISQELMRNPALLSDGRAQGEHVYEHDHVKKWVDTHGTEPTTRARLRNARITVNGPLQRAIRSWCEEKADLLRQGAATLRPAPVVRSGIHVFVDHSNVSVGATRATGKPLDIRRLVHGLERRRDARERVVVGSAELKRTGSEWKKLGYTILTEKGHGPEQLVDEALHAHAMRAAGKSFEPGRVMVLVTGDGNNNQGSTTFPECVSQALRNDWHVELYSWRQALSQVYLDLATQHASHVSIHYLDDVFA